MEESCKYWSEQLSATGRIRAAERKRFEAQKMEVPQLDMQNLKCPKQA